MRFTTALLAAFSAVGVLSAQTCGDLHNQESLLSCVAAPLSIFCTGADSVSCACSQLSVETDCMSKYCGGTVDPTALSAMTQIGCGGGSSPATTTAGSGASATPASGGTASTPTPTKNAAAVGAIPAGGMMVVAVVAVAYL